MTLWIIACKAPLSMGILQERILEWVPMPSSRGYFHIPYISSVAQLCPTLCDPMDCSMQCFLLHHQLPELAQTHVYWVDDAIQPSHPLSFPSPPAFNLYQHQDLFQCISYCIRWPKYWSFSISCSNEYSGLISFRINWYNLLVVQGILKSLLQHHS